MFSSVSDLLVQILLGIILFFLIFLVVTKFIEKKWLAVALAGLTATLLSPILYRGILVLFLFSSQASTKTDFDQQKWFDSPSQRHEMGDYIVESKLLIGKDSVGITALLGKPDRIRPDDQWVYDLGYSGKGFASTFVLLRLDYTNDVVSSAELLQVTD